MKYIMCTIFNKDTKEWSFGLPFKTEKLAVAEFSKWISKSNEDKYFHAADYDFYLAGFYDNETGVEKVLEDKKKLANGWDVVSGATDDEVV